MAKPYNILRCLRRRNRYYVVYVYFFRAIPFAPIIILECRQQIIREFRRRKPGNERRFCVFRYSAPFERLVHYLTNAKRKTKHGVIHAISCIFFPNFFNVLVVFLPLFTPLSMRRWVFCIVPFVFLVHTFFVVFII